MLFILILFNLKIASAQTETDLSNTTSIAAESETDHLEKNNTTGPAAIEPIANNSSGNAGSSNSSSTLNDTSSNLAEGTNKRETFLLNLKTSHSNSSNNVVYSSNDNMVIQNEGEIIKIRNADDNNSKELKYRRSSLYTMMINDTLRDHFNVIKDAFGNTELSEKFNDHNIGPYLIDATSGEKDQSEIITQYLNENGVARELVAKWFNRNQDGKFNMDLIATRGQYNASDLDYMIAGDSKRGEALLADAGEELIGNTFLIVNDYKYTNKEEVAKKASGFLSVIKDVASKVGYNDIVTAAAATDLALGVVGKGYVIKTTSYLYRLEWDDEVQSTFYQEYWMDDNNYESSKKEAFDTCDLFKLRLVGEESAWADLQSTVFTSKSEEDLIRIATVKATDKGISKLQRKFEEFRTKSPLHSGDPIAAQIGLKEGLEKGDRFEVLEQVIDEDGRTSYKRVGTIKVDPDKIWDNSYLHEENSEVVNSNPFTEFKGSNNKYYSGMLIRQIN